MKRLILVMALIALLGPPALAQKTLYVSPDVPTDDPGGSGTIFLPWDVIEYKSGLYTSAPAVTFPSNTAVDAIHKMDKPGHWLFSVEATAELPPGGGIYFQPEDVIIYDGFNYFLFFNGSALGVPVGVNVDAAFLENDDYGDLIISFDVPTTISGNTYDPADLVRYSGGVYSLFFDASAVLPGLPTSSNVTGADATPLLDILSFDIPTDAAPSLGPTTYLPGDIASWNGAAYSTYDNLAGWPRSSEVDAFSCQANPGRVYDRNSYQFPILMSKSLVSPGNVIVSWAPSCSSGAEEYGIYEGSIGTWYSHVKLFLVCVDADGVPLSEDFAPAIGSSYYLVVPHDFFDEGAYGLDYDPTRIPPRMERPQPTSLTSRCYVPQAVTACP